MKCDNGLTLDQCHRVMEIMFTALQVYAGEHLQKGGGLPLHDNGEFARVTIEDLKRILNKP